MNYLGLDIGQKRTGIAISKSGIIANEYTTVNNDSNISAIKKIKSIIDSESIEKVIIGLPRNIDGTDSEYTRYVRNFANNLRKTIKTPIEFEDETLTTQEAKRQLKELKVSDAEIKKRVDQYSAKLILEQYLD